MGITAIGMCTDLVTSRFSLVFRSAIFVLIVGFTFALQAQAAVPIRFESSDYATAPYTWRTAASPQELCGSINGAFPNPSYSGCQDLENNPDGPYPGRGVWSVTLSSNPYPELYGQTNLMCHLHYNSTDYPGVCDADDWASIATICPEGSAPDPTNVFNCIQDPNYLDPRLNLGPPDFCGDGNPINSATGNKYQIENDYVGFGPAALEFARYYNSSPDVVSAYIGAHWRHSYSRSIEWIRNDLPLGDHAWTVHYTAARIYRPDGKVITFQNEMIWGDWWSSQNAFGHLTQQLNADGSVASSRFVTPDDTVETYDGSGKLVSIATRTGFTQTLAYDAVGRLLTVSNSFGKTIRFSYDASNRIHTMTDVGGSQYIYAYDSAGNLSSVTYPGNQVRTYLYEDATYTHALTGIVDENGARFATWAYDLEGRAILSEHAGGTNRVAISYNTNGTATVINGLGAEVVRSFTRTVNGVIQDIGVSQVCEAGCGTAQKFYDTNGFLNSATDFNGNTTLYQHNSLGLQISRTLPNGVVIATQWHPIYRLPTRITEPGKETAYTYDTTGRLIQRTETDTLSSRSKAWSYSYNAQGLLANINGPRVDVNDVTSFTYDTSGNVATTVNALGHVTTVVMRDSYGRPTRISDPNGLVTDFSYDARGRMTSRTSGSESVSFNYDAVGNLTKITFPDSSFLSYTYDAAHRVVSISDDIGNHADFTLDVMGNRVRENVYDPSGVLRRTRSRTHDVLSHVIEEIGASNQITAYGYDANGNRVSAADPLGNATIYTFDELNRISNVTDAAYGNSTYVYGPNGLVSSVIDARGVTTTYEYNGFGDLTKVTSPDTGGTTYTRDEAGNVVTQTDARALTTSFQYDALNRVKLITYSGGASTTYTYDSGVNAVGHLVKLQDVTGISEYSYDAHGRVVQHKQTTNMPSSGTKVFITAYSYDTRGRLTQTTYPSGMVVVNSYINGRVTGMTVNGQALATNITYQAFGPAKGWNWGNGVAFTRGFDLDGRMATQSMGTSTRSYTYDADSRITNITDPYHNLTYGYDELDRLVQSSGTYSRSYAYDPNGNRTSSVVGGTVTSYATGATNNRLLSTTSGTTTKNRSYDAFGNTLNDGTYRYVYDERERMMESRNSSNTLLASYKVNALGQRVSKTMGSTTTYFTYDEAGHLIGEYNGTGALIEETIYLGDMPLGVWMPSKLYFVQADHLNTPRAFIDSSNRVVWLWKAEPFGSIAPNNDPDGDGIQVTYNLRFPGQYYDAETGLHYNYFRDFDPRIGRYVESDPIGLRGGFNTYAYVNNNSLRFIDPFGLLETDPPIDPENPILDPKNPPNPLPPGGIPEQPLPQPRPPKPPGRPSCGQLFRLCMGACVPRCPGPPFVKGGLCAALCTASWVACVSGGGEQ